jgi:hypothetical protein
MLRGKENWMMVALVVSLVIFTGSDAFGVNLLTNGDFETGQTNGDTPTGWTGYGANFNLQHWDSSINMVYEGSASMWFNAQDYPLQDWIESNTFTLEPNSVYELTFKVRAHYENTDGWGGGAQDGVHVSIPGSDSLFEETVSPREHTDDEGWSMFYHYHELIGTGPSASSGHLRLSHIGAPNAYLWFDNISLERIDLEGLSGTIEGDANQDGQVSAGDYSSVQAHFGETAGGATIPEPMTMSILGLGGLAVLRRRRR